MDTRTFESPAFQEFSLRFSAFLVERHFVLPHYLMLLADNDEPVKHEAKRVLENLCLALLSRDSRKLNQVPSLLQRMQALIEPHRNGAIAGAYFRPLFALIEEAMPYFSSEQSQLEGKTEQASQNSVVQHVEISDRGATADELIASLPEAQLNGLLELASNMTVQKSPRQILRSVTRRLENTSPGNTWSSEQRDMVARRFVNQEVSAIGPMAAHMTRTIVANPLSDRPR